MSIRISFGSRWFSLYLFDRRFTAYFYIQMECGHNSTRNLLTIWKDDSKALRMKDKAGTFLVLGSRKAKRLVRLEREYA